MFAAQSVYLGAGIVGGALMSIDDLSRNTADAAIRLLNGAPPRSINVPPQSPGQPTFDWRELQRWGIRREPVAAGQRRALSSSEPVARIQGHGSERGRRAGHPIAPDCRAPVQRRARQRAEIDSRRNLALAADASRRETMSALTSSIAHELGQPLSSMMHNAQALQMMVAANRCDTRDDRRDPVRYPEPGRPRHADHRSPSDDAPKPSAGQEADRSSRRDQ